jgi:hypothetical protein
MSKKIKKIGLVVLLLAIAIQFYRPHKNEQKETTTDDFLITEKAPNDIRSLLKTSCYNCHSNDTKYSWYDNIAPASWYIDDHIKKAKAILNFSNWATIDARDRNGLISEIAVNIQEDKMPLPSYTMIHPEAKLSDAEKKQLIAWLSSL